MNRPVDLTEKRARLLYALAALTFVPTLFFYYVGEEAIFPLTSYEMWHAGEWVRQFIYGVNLKHNPLYNWLIIPLAQTFGWDHVLVVARALTVAATISTGLVLGWLAQALYGDRVFSAFAALLCLTLADTFFYRGWLAYVDPLFGLFIVSAIAALWVGCERRSYRLLLAAAIAISLAFMAKAFTAYVFYGVACAVLLLRPDYRRFLLGYRALLTQLVVIAVPVIWLQFLPQNTGQGGRLFAEMLSKLEVGALSAYLLKLIAYPAETLVRLSPAVALAAYYGWRRRELLRGGWQSHDAMIIAIALVNYLPYWLAPISHSRYLVPIYPLFALIIARLLWRAGALAVTGRWIMGLIIAKLIVVLVVFPLYQEHYRGRNYEEVARDIVVRTQGQPLYTSNVSASGVSVSMHANLLRPSQPPLTFPPEGWRSGFLIAYTAEPKDGQVVIRYRLGGTDLYLLCRGEACAAPDGSGG